MPLAQLRPGEGEHVERMAAGPVEQVLDEVEHCSVGPVEILEEQHDRAGLRHPLEEETPGRVEILPVRRDTVGQPEHMLEARLHPLALVRVGYVLLERRVQLGERSFRPILFCHSDRPAPVGRQVQAG